MCDDIERLGIPCTIILDSTVGYIMESVDMVMVGAEGVVESGGIINKVGAFGMIMKCPISNEMQRSNNEFLGMALFIIIPAGIEP